MKGSPSRLIAVHGLFGLTVIATVVWKLLVAAHAIDALHPATVATGYPHQQARDFALNIWIPGRVLLAGHDPYMPGAAYLKARYHPNVPPGLYTPSLLLLSLPLILLPLRAAAFGALGLTVSLIWLSVWVIARPKTGRAWIALSGLGVMLIASWPTSLALLWGQPAALFTLGAALIAAGLRDANACTGRRALACGVFLMCQKPQFGIPAVVAMLLMREHRAARVGLMWTVILSIPFSVLELVAVGGLGRVVTAVRLNLKTLGKVDAAGIPRTDFAALVTHGAITTGPEVLAFLAATVVLAAALVLAQRRGGEPLVLATMVALVGYSLVSLYHSLYDLAVLYVVVPLAFVSTTRILARALAALLLAYYFVAGLAWNVHSLPHLMDRLLFGPRTPAITSAAVLAAGLVALTYDVEPFSRIRGRLGGGRQPSVNPTVAP